MLRLPSFECINNICLVITEWWLLSNKLQGISYLLISNAHWRGIPYWNMISRSEISIPTIPYESIDKQLSDSSLRQSDWCYITVLTHDDTCQMLELHVVTCVLCMLVAIRCLMRRHFAWKEFYSWPYILILSILRQFLMALGQSVHVEYVKYIRNYF